MNRSIVPLLKVRFMLRVTVTMLMLALALSASGVPLRPLSKISAQDVGVAGQLVELAVDSGSASWALGPGDPLKGKPGLFGWSNKLTPPSYPATIRAVTIGFERNNVGISVKPDALYRIVVYRDPEGNGPNPGQQPDASFIGRVRGEEQIMTFNLITPLTIQSGSFAVGAIDQYGIAEVPALFDSPGKSTPPGSESFFTQNGGVSWQKLSTALDPSPSCGPGSFLIRATVELGTVDALTVTKIKDPAAVEPWGVGLLETDVIVANLVSDNVTIINAVNNTFQNIAITDPRLCPMCGPPLGPFGVASSSTRLKAYVTLFGSNTIPSKEFPVDSSTVLPGRVAVLTRQSNGSYTQSSLVSVGKGPRFPAFAAGKIYVPCGGDDRVDVISTVTDLKVAQISVGDDPSSCTASFDGAKIYVTNFGDGKISVIDTTTDKKIKDIPAPKIQLPTPVGGQPPAPAIGQNPWQGTISSTNGNLYVTYWATTAGDVTPNGALVEFDTCKDEFLRANIDDTTAGTAPGSAGASGIPAPTAALTRDPATGRTLQAGGGGGGPFGIKACFPTGGDFQPSGLVFTNDGLGIVGVLDARIDQVVSAPPIAVASCPKPRGVVCVVVPSGGTRFAAFAYVACGQPDNSVLFFRVRELPENIANIPVIESLEFDNVIRIVGSGFVRPGTQLDITHLELLKQSTCLTFNKPLKFKKGGSVLIQKGSLSDGTSIADENNVRRPIRIVNPDGSVRMFFQRFGAVPVN